MKLIASGAYLQDEFVIEIGLIPPSFLPIGNKRLYEYQIDFFQKNRSTNDIYISIPNSYNIKQCDRIKIQELGVKIIKVPDGLTLGESIQYCWNASGKYFNSLEILHGDTLFRDFYCKQENFITVHKNNAFYQRSILDEKGNRIKNFFDDWKNESDNVISGYFCFNKPHSFMKHLVKSKNNFINSIIDYQENNELFISNSGEWLDFGHIKNFYKSRTKITTQRSFNNLKITEKYVYKSSEDENDKIGAESYWFQNIPIDLNLFTPNLLEVNNDNINSYKLEYLHILPLSDLYLFSNLSNEFWEVVFKEIGEMLKAFSKHVPEKLNDNELGKYDSLYLNKTINRLNELSHETINIDSQIKITKDKTMSCREIAEITSRYISKTTKEDLAVVHGDLCFSNILFDNKTDRVKCIDPRGKNAFNEFSIYGDKRYDIAKLLHSVYGLYDNIIAGRYKIINNEDNIESIEFYFERSFDDVIMKYFKTLFLSLLILISMPF